MKTKLEQAKELLLPALRQHQHNDCSGLIVAYDYYEVNKIVSNLVENRVIASEHTEGSSANGAAADIKEIIYTALDELTAIDQALRLESETIYNPLKLRSAINTAFKATCDIHKIAYEAKDLRPEGDKQINAIIDLIKRR